MQPPCLAQSFSPLATFLHKILIDPFLTFSNISLSFLEVLLFMIALLILANRYCEIHPNGKQRTTGYPGE